MHSIIFIITLNIWNFTVHVVILYAFNRDIRGNKKGKYAIVSTLQVVQREILNCKINTLFSNVLEAYFVLIKLVKPNI